MAKKMAINPMQIAQRLGERLLVIIRALEQPKPPRKNNKRTKRGEDVPSKELGENAPSRQFVLHSENPFDPASDPQRFDAECVAQ